MRCNRESFSVSKILHDRRTTDLSPTYQRDGGVWSLAKKQLFMDSLVNGYDIPKIYVHDVDGKDGYEYAVVDGKQRIGTVLAFLDNEFAFGPDFVYSGPRLDDPPRAGQKYRDLASATQDRVRDSQLDFVVIRTRDEEEIEELFSRLNNGEKLNAAESRNAFGGKMCALIRELANDPFITNKIAFANTRYAHYEVTAKLLYLESESEKARTPVFVDLKKKFLDDFVKGNRTMSDADARKLLAKTQGRLREISPVFDAKDIELSKQSYPQLMYLFVGSMLRHYGGNDLKANLKKFLVDFRIARADNLLLDEDKRDPELAEYGRLMQQGTNDASSMQKRVEILTKRFLKANPAVLMKDPRRAFTFEERWVLWHRSGKKCEECGTVLNTLDELDGDHIVWHSLGGPTTLSNARALCIPCNRGHASV
jgi:hypothetical protein